MGLLTSPTKTMSLRSSLESQGNTWGLSRPRRSPPRRAKMRPSQHLQRVKPRKEKQRLRERERLLRKVLLLQKARPLQLLQRKHPQRSREMCDSSLSVRGGEGEAAAPKSPHCCATSPFPGRVFVEIFLCVTLSPMS